MQSDSVNSTKKNERDSQRPHASQGEQLLSMLQPDVPIFILIDPMVTEVFPEIGQLQTDATLDVIRRKVWERETTRINLPASIYLPIHQHPYLVHVTDKSDCLLALSLKIANDERLAAQADGLDGEGQAAHRIGGWLQSASDPTVIAECIGEMCRVNTSAYTRATYFRIVDRRVLSLMGHVVGEERMTAQFGPVRSWVFLDPIGHLLKWTGGGGEAKPLRQSVQEWKRMRRGELLHRSMAKWMGALAHEGNFSVGSVSSIFCAFEESIAALPIAKKKWPNLFTNPHDESVWVAISMLHPSLTHNQKAHKIVEDFHSSENPPEPLRYLHEQICRALAEIR